MSGEVSLWGSIKRLSVVMTIVVPIVGGAWFVVEGVTKFQGAIDRWDNHLTSIDASISTLAAGQAKNEQRIDSIQGRQSTNEAQIARTAEAINRVDQTTQTMSGQLAEIVHHLLGKQTANADSH